MSPTVDGVPAHEALGSAYDHGALSSKSLLCATALGFKQALTSLNLAPTDLWSGRISIQENATLDDQDSTMIIKEDFSYIVRVYTARADMARPSDSGPVVTQIKDKSVVVMDCGASRTVTGSLLNTREVN
jgi:RNase P/RNase MRP subunit p30